MAPAAAGGDDARGEWGEARPKALAQLVIGLSRHTPLGRGGGRRLLANWLSAVHPGPVDTRLWGVPVRLHPWRNVSERKALLRPDRMDPEEHALVARLMAGRPSVFIDVGANAGLYSLNAALAAAPGSLIVAVEPNRNLVRRFLFNLSLARQAGAVAPDTIVETRAVALSDYEGEGALSQNGHEGGRHLVGDEGEGQRVPVTTLARLASELRIDRIDVLKIDVEGHEDRVLPPFLMASPQTLWPRTIIIEHLSRESWSVDCIADCLHRGYRQVARSRNNTVLMRDDGALPVSSAPAAH